MLVEVRLTDSIYYQADKIHSQINYKYSFRLHKNNIDIQEKLRAEDYQRNQYFPNELNYVF